jgi:Na+/H+ antiporter NhaD/arsenite permease-like protein
MDLPVWTATPFVALLACVALLPILRGNWWHSNRNKTLVSMGLAVPTAIYLVAIGGKTQGESTHLLWHEVGEFASFIVLLTSLYTIAGGIVLTGDIPAKPRTNTLFLAVGAVLANFIGTTGASMVLIRPVLRINRQRRRRSHLPIFFIIIVSNTGGLLTPLGDPPLFLGFVQGVDFVWTLRLWPQWLFVNGLVLAAFHRWDVLAYRREPIEALRHDSAIRHRLRLSGLGVNGFLMLGVLLAVIAQSRTFGQKAGQILGAGDLTLQKPWGELAIVALTALSLLLTRRSLRRINGFAWGPMIEVAVLFAGIFVTMAPALALLHRHGPELNLTEAWQFFWLTGLLSAFLDNAPTYLTFATLASAPHDLRWLSANSPAILAAISCGTVFMGALTYVGNGPNFMVKAIAEEQRFKMPSFFGYMKYSFGILMPALVVATILFFI